MVSAVASLGTRADCTTPIPTEIINVAITGGATPTNFSYQVAIDGGAYDSLNAIPAGATSFTYPATSIGSFYEFKITDNTTGCSIISNAYTVPVFNTMTVTASAAANVDCATNATGAIEINITGYSGAYTYEIFRGSTTTGFIGSGDTLTNPFVLPHGLIATTSGSEYTVVVTQTAYPSCPGTSLPVTITEPAVLALSPTITVVNQNCNNTGATITVPLSSVTGGTGGTLGYTFAFVPNGTGVEPIASAFGPSNFVTLPTTQIAPLFDTVEVWVKDTNDCTVMQTVRISLDDIPTILDPGAQCFVGAPIVIDLSSLATVPVGPAQFYTVNGSNQTNATYTITKPGSYYFSVTDANGCISNTVTYTVVNQLIAGALLDKDLTCAPTPAATINVTITGGVGPFSYQMFNGVTAVGGITPVTGTTFTVNPTTAGTYSFLITDSYSPTCSVTTNPVEVTIPVPPTFTAVPTDATCNGDSNGTITVTPTAGVAPFTFALSGGFNTTGDATGNYSGLPAGSYTVTITDAKGCPATSATPIIIGEPAAVRVDTFVVTTPLRCGPSNVTLQARVTAQGVGGNGSYEYNFNNEGWTKDDFYLTNIAGPVSVLVRDTNLCTVSAAVSIPVDALDKPKDLAFLVTTEPTCLANTATVQVTATDGVGSLDFDIIEFNNVPTTFYLTQTTPGSGTPASFANLPPGDYTFRVTDSNGCTYQELYPVAPVVNIAATVATITNETCFNTDNGTATFTVSNSVGYTATLTVGTGSPQITGNTVSLTALAPGNYNLQVEDITTRCRADVPFTIAGIAQVLDFNTTPTNINCNNDEAIITVTATGGTLDYKYAVALATAPAPAVTDYSLSSTLTVDTNNGTNMNWIVYVLDANGCPINKPQTILVDANPTIASAVATQCPSTTGTYDITVTASGFSSALEYSADGTNYQTGNVITVNAPGNYTITVKDANGCISVGFPVSIVDPLILTPTVSTPVTCADGDGVVTVSTTGGSGNYVYNIDGGTFASVTSFLNVASGNHTIGVRDTTTLCEVFATVNLQVATPVTGFALAKTEVTCNGGTDGSITATMDTPAPGVNDNPVYTYTLTGTTTVGNLPVTRPAQDSPLFSGLSAGSYTVVVTSERGCTDTETITIFEPGLITVPAPTVVQFGCTSGNAGNLATITVTGVTGGTTPYLNYEFIKNGTQVQFGDSNVYTEANLSGGSYIVNVYDSKRCIGTTTAAITINPYIQLDKVNVNVTRAITCLLPENISVSATTIGGPATNLQYTLVDVTYDNTTTPPTAIKGSIYPAVTNPTGVFANLPVGNYEITVRNLDTNCEIIGVHYVNQPNTFDLTIDNLVDVTCLGDTNGSARVTLIDTVITATSPNQAGPFTYTVTGPVASTGTATTAGPITLTNLTAGAYSITAVLSNSPFCTVSKNFTISGPNAALVISETHTAITCVAGNNDGSISATATGGWPGGYEFQLERGATVVTPWSTVSNFNGLTAGNYTVKVRDPKGCEVSTTVPLVIPTLIDFIATPSTTLLTCNGDTNARITVSAPTGGQGSNYLYTLNTTSVTPMISSGPQSGNVFDNLGAGTYTITVTDGWGCGTTSAPIVIAQPTKVVASLVLATTQTCFTQSTITLSAIGGTGAYEYSTTPNFAAIEGNFATRDYFPCACRNLPLLCT